jgi:hypothetical protein
MNIAIFCLSLEIKQLKIQTNAYGLYETWQVSPPFSTFFKMQQNKMITLTKETNTKWLLLLSSDLETGWFFEH